MQNGIYSCSLRGGRGCCSGTWKQEKGMAVDGGDLHMGNKSDERMRITKNECKKKKSGAAGRLLDYDLSHVNLQRVK